MSDLITNVTARASERASESETATTTYKTKQQREEEEWKALQRLALDYDDTKTFGENEEINPDVAYAWERVGEIKLKEKMELMRKVYASMGINI
jgi:hypothetical protein